MVDLFTFESKGDLSIEKQNEWLKAIVHSIQDGVLVIDKKGIVKIINPEYTKITGVKSENIIGKSLTEVRPGARLIETLRDAKTRVGIYRKVEDKEYVVDMAPIIVNKKIVGAVSVCKGIQEVKKLSEELKKNKEKLAKLEKKVGSLNQANFSFDQIIGSSDGLKDLIKIAKKAATADLPALIIGESGTGKELFAQSIHNESDRAGQPFVPVNCATIPSELIESELFGYEEGAFTNAKKGGKMGLFEIADSGTIFLDEIGELSNELQAKFLRVLQEGTIRKVGGTKEKKVNVRVIAATNKNLQHLVEKKYFREDLFYRLNVLTLNILPLRERKEDIPILVDSILNLSPRYKELSTSKVYCTVNTMNILKQYEWPGNVRELKNAIDYALCMTDGTEISPQHLPKVILNATTTHNESYENSSNQTLKDFIEDKERQFIIESLKQASDDSVEGKQEIAKRLGVSLATLYNKMKKYNIEF